ncbi:MAG: hypothetical protein AB7E45_07925 [Candidatus Caldatribacteriota bacterium]
MASYSDLLTAVRIRVGDYQGTTYGESYIADIIKLGLADTRLSNILSPVSLVPQGNTYVLNREITEAEKDLIAIASHLKFLYARKTSLDESSLSMTKGRLRIDNTSQARSLGETISLVEQEFSLALRNFINLQGVRVE